MSTPKKPGSDHVTFGQDRACGARTVATSTRSPCLSRWAFSLRWQSVRQRAQGLPEAEGREEAVSDYQIPLRVQRANAKVIRDSVALSKLEAGVLRAAVRYAAAAGGVDQDTRGWKNTVPGSSSSSPWATRSSR